MSTTTFVFTLALALSTSACGNPAASSQADAGDEFPLDAYGITKTTSKELSIEYRTAPTQPPIRGVLDVELSIRDADGFGQDGLLVDVTPWMPAMGHGASTLPSIKAIGGGNYVVSQLNLFMPGRWELRISISGPTTDSAIAVLDVQ